MDFDLRNKILHALYEKKDTAYVREQAYWLIVSPDLNKETLDFIVSIADDVSIHVGQICEEMSKEAAERFLSEGTKYDWLAEHPTADRNIVYNYLLNEVAMDRIIYFLQIVDLPEKIRNKLYQKFAKSASASMISTFLEDEHLSSQVIKDIYFNNPNMTSNLQFYVFKHPNTPLKVLKHGLEHVENLVHIILGRDDMTESVLLNMVKKDSGYISGMIASSPDISFEVIQAILSNTSDFAVNRLLVTQLGLTVPTKWQDYVWVNASDGARREFVEDQLTRLGNIPPYVRIESILGYNLNESNLEYFKGSFVDFKEAFNAYVKNFTDMTEDLDGLPMDWAVELVRPYVVERLNINV